jgi:cytohesin
VWCHPAISDQIDDLRQAAASGDLATLRALLKANPGLASAYGGFATPLHIAARRGQKDAAELLLANHADVDARDEYRQTPLHLTADWGYTRLAELLLTHGADVNAKDRDNETPLHIAARVHQSELAELLLAHGAEVNAKDREGWTPLHWAADRRTHERQPQSGRIVELLLAKGADVTARSNGGFTPLHFAASVGDRDAAELLLANHADVNATDDRGETPLGVGLVGHDDLVELLRQYGGQESRPCRFAASPTEDGAPHNTIRTRRSRSWFRRYCR